MEKILKIIKRAQKTLIENDFSHMYKILLIYVITRLILHGSLGEFSPNLECIIFLLSKVEKVLFFLHASLIKIIFWFLV